MKSLRTRLLEEKDFEGITALCRKTYPNIEPWTAEQLAHHLEIFPEGQIVAVDEHDEVVGYSASLVVPWQDFSVSDSWSDFTSDGYFDNHDLTFGDTLYGAEVMVDCDVRGRGVGSLLYKARRELAIRLNLRTIRAGARIPGYWSVKHLMSARHYVSLVGAGLIWDKTLSFQIKNGFKIISVSKDYIKDKQSCGYAAVIEWVNRRWKKRPSSRVLKTQINAEA